MATILIILTRENGSTREVHYEIAGGDDRASILFDTLKDAAWAASPYPALHACPVCDSTYGHAWNCTLEAK
jgi:hypothetical protein